MADAGVVDAGVADAGATDAGVADAGATDAGSADAGAVDAGADDAGAADAGGVLLQPLDGDPDADGLVNALEFAVGTSPLVADTDGDGLADGAEVLLLGTVGTRQDTDDDGLSDSIEVGGGPTPLDGDGDHVIDAVESSSWDRDGDGAPDQSDPDDFTTRAGPEVGFSVQFYGLYHPIDSVDRLRVTADELTGKVDWIRFNFFANELVWASCSRADAGVLCREDPRDLELFAGTLPGYDQGLSDLAARGFKVLGILTPPSYLSFSPLEYAVGAGLYAEAVVGRWGSQIDVWQVYNEANWSDLRTGGAPGGATAAANVLPTLSTAYLAQLRQGIAIARQRIKARFPHARITSNAAGYPGAWPGIGEAPGVTGQKLRDFFQGLSRVIDFPSVDVYSEPAHLEAAAAREFTQRLAADFGRPWIMETGFFRCGVDAGQQGGLITSLGDHFVDAGIQHLLLYEYGDRTYNLGVHETDAGNSIPAECLGSFGLVGAGVDRAVWPAYNEVLGWAKRLRSSRPFDELGVYRPAPSGTFFMDLNGNHRWDSWDLFTPASVGAAGDLPIAGRWTDPTAAFVGVYRPSSRTFLLDSNGDRALGGGDAVSQAFGPAGAAPVVGDWNGDGLSEIGVFDAASRTFTLDANANLTLDASDRVLGPVGLAGDVPIAGDWDGDGRASIGLYRPGTGQFLLDQNGDGVLSAGEPVVTVQGAGVGTPLAADWDGDGRTNVGVFEPATQRFRLSYEVRGRAIVIESQGFGAAGDLPIAGAWRP